MATENGGKRKFIIPIVVIIALIALAWGVKTWLYSRGHESTDDAQVDGHIVPVLAKVGGYVNSVAVDENQHVNEGQVLVTIDDAEYRVRVASAEADLQAAQGVAGAGSTTGQAEAQVQSAAGQQATLAAQVAAARANDVNAQQNLARMRDLASKQIVSRQQLDAAQAAADAAHANFLAAERQVTAAGANVSTAQAGVRVADARLAAARAALDNAKLQLSYTKITAPASGLVSRKTVEVGQLVNPGQPVMSIVADTGVWVTANFKETQLASIRVGQPVDIDVDAYGCTAEGKVESLSGATGAKFALLPPDNATGNFTKVVQRVPVRVAVTRGCGAAHPLRPGLSVNVHVTTKS
jgi:membrane fusion protein (multidrug efflux system)